MQVGRTLCQPRGKCCVAKRRVARNAEQPAASGGGTVKRQGTTGEGGAVLENVDSRTVEDFGKEWARFSYGDGRLEDVRSVFDSYFEWIADDLLSADRKGADFGCGSGRWSALVAPRVRELWCIDASAAALAVARGNLAELGNCHFAQEAIGELSIPDETFDFGYCLGVLHHVPDTERGLKDCVRTLKRGAPFLVYLYYALDNRPGWYRRLWQVTNAVRWCIAAMPHPLKVATCEVIAALVYWPLVQLSQLVERLGCNVANWPLSFYRGKAYYILRNDALDRFGTRLEKRFTKRQILALMESSGLRDIRFSERPPYWLAIGWKV